MSNNGCYNLNRPMKKGMEGLKLRKAPGDVNLIIYDPMFLLIYNLHETRKDKMILFRSFIPLRFVVAKVSIVFKAVASR